MGDFGFTAYGGMIMEGFKWQHIQFADGSNPYICKTEKDFKWMQKHYNLEKIEDGFWIAR